MSMPHEKKIRIMTEGGAILGDILQELLDTAQPHVRLQDIEDVAQKRIKEAGGTPSFMTVEGYTWATCLCVNDVIVHGVPSGQRLREGDGITIDIGMVYKGFHTDTAWTKIVHGPSFVVDQDVQIFLDTGKIALKKAIDSARIGNRIGHISQAIQQTIEEKGYGVVKTLIGHGVGEALHMPPQIPGILRGPLEKTPKIIEGMSLAIEVIYTMGNPAVHYVHDDGWSIATSDGSLSAVFEQTIVIKDGVPIEATPSH